jgi:uncharacterized protein (TIGR00730 family)
MNKKKSSGNSSVHCAHAAHGVRNVCVYCGSGKGGNPAYAAAARHLGKALAEAGVGLVYGGGSLGLMGEVARATLKHGGRVTGIIPAFLSNRERMLKEVSELVVTEDMHQRKMEMFKRSDAFVALPGGIGTLEELVEQLTWAQLGRHVKPIVLANIDGFWKPFLVMLNHMAQENFIRPGLEVSYIVADRAQDILPKAIDAARAASDKAVPAIEAQF